MTVFVQPLALCEEDNRFFHKQALIKNELIRYRLAVLLARRYDNSLFAYDDDD